MTVRLITCRDTPPEPWKNGGGVTRVLLADTHVPWRWRISVADIASDGPFSNYPETERWFAVAEGAGVELSIDGTIHQLDHVTAPLRFSGASLTMCRLRNGKVRDLNLMLRGIRGLMARAVPDVSFVPGFPSCGLFTVTPGRCISEGGEIQMPGFSLAWFSAAPETLRWLDLQAEAGRSSAPTAYWLAIGTETTE